MAVKNFYTVLGIQQTDSEDTIKKAYRTLAKKYHPDLNPGDKAAEEKMRQISEAWETLGDAKKRNKYDQELAGGPKKAPFSGNASNASQSNRPMTQEDFYTMSQSFDSMFSEDAIRKSAKQASSSRANPMDTTDFFERVMGFKGPRKK